MAKLYNRVRQFTATAGTGTVTLGAAYSNAWFTFAEAGVANGDVVRYIIEDGSDFEIGLGTYTSAGTTLSRDTVTASKIGGTAGTTKITLSGSAVVRIDAAKEDLDLLATKVKLLSFTRDLTTASGNQAVTGAGFAPKAVVILAAIFGQAAASVGLADGSSSDSLIAPSDATNMSWLYSGNVVDYTNSATTARQGAGLASLDADGFTLSWVKTGAPTGTLQMFALCIG